MIEWGIAPEYHRRLAGCRLQGRYHAGIFDVFEGLQPLAEGKGCTMSQFALAWWVSQPGVTSPIIGPRTMTHLDDNLGALAVNITVEDTALADKLVPPERMVSPFYEADFGPHKYRW